MDPTAEPEASQSATTTTVPRGGHHAAGSAMLGLAWLIRLVFGIAATVVVVAIVLRVLGANPANQVVIDFHRWGRHFVGPFHNLFSIRNVKLATAVNWGIAAFVIVVIGDVLARIAARIGLATA
jgi:hypothetical protein